MDSFRTWFTLLLGGVGPSPRRLFFPLYLPLFLFYNYVRLEYLSDPLADTPAFVTGLYVLSVGFATLLGIQRLRAAGLTAWWMAFNFIPIVGWMVCLALFTRPSVSQTAV